MTKTCTRASLRLTREFESRHPARAELRKFIEKLVAANRHRGAEARRDRERVRAVDDISALHGMTADLLGEIFDIIKAPMRGSSGCDPPLGAAWLPFWPGGAITARGSKVP
jgi:hypothetical protein